MEGLRGIYIYIYIYIYIHKYIYCSFISHNKIRFNCQQKATMKLLLLLLIFLLLIVPTYLELCRDFQFHVQDITNRSKNSGQ